MSILIKNMRMPETCGDCPLQHSEYLECKITHRITWGWADGGGTRTLSPAENDCPLVELPEKHGRLGDLDAMAFDESEAYMSAQAKLGRDVITTGINSIVHRKIQLLIMDTPTVIEAEG